MGSITVGMLRIQYTSVYVEVLLICQPYAIHLIAQDTCRPAVWLGWHICHNATIATLCAFQWKCEIKEAIYPCARRAISAITEPLLEHLCCVMTDVLREAP